MAIWAKFQNITNKGILSTLSQGLKEQPAFQGYSEGHKSGRVTYLRGDLILKGGAPEMTLFNQGISHSARS